MLVKQIRVLLVDDDCIDRESMLRFVQDCQLPYEIHPAASKKEAEEFLAAMPFDVVLLDYELGDGSGLDLLGAMGDAAGIGPCLMSPIKARPAAPGFT